VLILLLETQKKKAIHEHPEAELSLVELIAAALLAPGSALADWFDRSLFCRTR